MYIALIFLFLSSSQAISQFIFLVLLLFFMILNFQYFLQQKWVDYLLILVYMGGVLVLFFYFTSFMPNFISGSTFSLKVVAMLFILQFFFPPFVSFYNENCSGGVSSGMFLFAFYGNLGYMILGVMLVLLILLFSSLTLKSSAPMRQA